MQLKRFSDAMRELEDLGLDLTDFYILARYMSAKDEGDVTTIQLSSSIKMSRTVLHRRIKGLVRKGFLVKTENTKDMRRKPLVDGPAMQSVFSILENV